MCRPVNAFRGLGVETGRRTSSARLQRIACCAGTPDVSKRKRRRSESNRRIEVLQTSALPLGYGAERNVRSQLTTSSARVGVRTVSRESRLVAIMVAEKKYITQVAFWIHRGFPPTPSLRARLA